MLLWIMFFIINMLSIFLIPYWAYFQWTKFSMDLQFDRLNCQKFLLVVNNFVKLNKNIKYFRQYYVRFHCILITFLCLIFNVHIENENCVQLSFHLLQNCINNKTPTKINSYFACDKSMMYMEMTHNESFMCSLSLSIGLSIDICKTLSTFSKSMQVQPLILTRPFLPL